MSTKVTLSNVRPKITEVVNLFGESVGATMGPGGQSVLLETAGGQAIVTKDGVTVANAIDLEDPESNIIAKIIKQAADKTNKEAGDGTTTATVLAKAIYNSGFKLIAAGHNPNLIKQQMDKAKETLFKALDEITTKIPETDNMQPLENIAKISLNGDGPMAKIVAEAVSKTGVKGLVKVVDNTKAIDELSVVPGIEFPAGFASPFFKQDAGTDKVVLENAAILITSHRLNSLHQLAALEPALKYFMEKSIPVVFIASEVSGPFLTQLVMNQKKGALKNCATLPPYYGMVRKEFYTDLAIATGATVIESEEKMELAAVETKHFGYAKRVEITNLKTTVIEGAAKSEFLNVRIQKLKEEAETVDIDKDLNKVHERLAKLSGSVMLIKVARESQVEVEERKHRIEDALNATKAALEEGYVPGGGAALYLAARDMDKEIPGQVVLAEALQYPAKKILINAGFSDKELYPLDEGRVGVTIDAKTGKPVPAYQCGIIDPVKVTKAALNNAISVAGTLLTTDVIISKIAKPANSMPFEMY